MKSIMIKILAIACLPALGMIGGCGTSDSTMAPLTAAKDTLPASAYPQVIMQDGLESVIVVSEPPNVMPATDSLPMRVRLALRSVTDDHLNIKVKFVFYGADGTILTDNPVWQKYAMLPRSREYIDGNSISLSAVRWEAQVAGD